MDKTDKDIIKTNPDLREDLKQNILDRYDNEEYWDDRIIEDWIADNDAKLEETRKIEG